MESLRIWPDIAVPHIVAENINFIFSYYRHGLAQVENSLLRCTLEFFACSIMFCLSTPGYRDIFQVRERVVEFFLFDELIYRPLKDRYSIGNPELASSVIMSEILGKGYPSV